MWPRDDAARITPYFGSMACRLIWEVSAALPGTLRPPVNNEGTVVGFSDLPGDSNGAANYQAFIWTRSTGVKKLPLLPGETNSAAFGINDRGSGGGIVESCWHFVPINAMAER
jgi:hypothetical protein